MRSVPTIVFPDGSILVEPGARELAAKCLQEPEPSLGERLREVAQQFTSHRVYFLGEQPNIIHTRNCPLECSLDYRQDVDVRVYL